VRVVGSEDARSDLSLLRIDEIWGFIGKKEKHLMPEDDPTLLECVDVCAIDSETKLVPSYKCGKSTRVYAWCARDRRRRQTAQARDRIAYPTPATSPRKAVQLSIVSDYREQLDDAES
jgi:hypothetical protein